MLLSKPKVLVAVCNEGWIRPEVATALYQITSDPRVSSKVYFPSIRTYENNLSQIVLKVKKEGWDYLLIIDDDNPPKNNPVDLIELNLDVVGCPTPQWNDIDPFPIYWVAMDKVEGGYKPHQNMVGLQEVDAVGTGCMLIKREVLESLEAPFTRLWNKDGTMELGVDFHFCEQAKAKGFRIWAHYDYICDHFKELSLIKVLEFKNQNFGGLDMVSRSYENFNSFGDITYPEQRQIYANLGQILQDKTILDAGCGIGWGTAILEESNYVTGIDIEGIGFAKKLYPFCEFKKQDISKKIDENYDVVVCIEVIEHIKDYKRAFKNLLNATKEVLYLSTPNKNNLTISKTKPHNPYHVKEFYPEEIIKLAKPYKIEMLNYQDFKPLDLKSEITPIVYKVKK